MTLKHVPFMDLARTLDPLHGATMDAIDDVVRSHRYIKGPRVEAFEHAMTHACGVRHAIGVSSGTDALLVSLMALGVGAGDEVITTPMTFFATAGCIARLGATPVFVDIDPITYNIDPSQIERAITARTKAILPVHLYGHMAQMDELLAVAHAHNLPIVEDAAQAVGATSPEGPAGSVGDFGCLSFFPTKNLGGAGDGGMVMTQDDQQAAHVRVLASHGANPKYVHALIGGNFRLDALQAAVLSVKLPYLEAWNAQRQANAQRYSSLLSALPVTLPVVRAGYTSTFHQYCIRVPNRDAVQQQLKELGVQTMVYYPVALHEQACFAHLGYTPQDLPEATRASKEVLALPIFPGLTVEEQEHVATALKQVLSNVSSTQMTSI